MNKIILLLLLSFSFLSAQNNSEIFIPLNVQKAYDSNTRSYDGKPGENYWINKTAYKMNVRLDTKTKQIFGNAEITYYNNSPDSLDEVVFKLYQQLFKKGNPRDFGLTPTDIHDGTNFPVIKCGDDTLDIKGKRIKRTSTTLSVLLPEKIISGGSKSFYFEWDFKIPETATVRMGAYSDTSIFMAYWYPQIAVYDDIDGWDMVEYTGMAETYNDFNDYDVTIEAPDNFLVWATGELQNSDEIFAEKVLSRINEAKNSEKIINIILKDDSYETIFQSSGRHLYHFTAKHVPDFAFGAAKNYLWDGSSVIVDSATRRKSFVQAAYDQKSEEFYKVADVAAKTIKYFSTETPGIPYPYPSMTVFNGSGGMEFPMIVNDGNTSTYASTVGLTSHEIAHTYFPFFMGTNERKHAWMDEGWARMLPTDFQEREGKYDPDDDNAKAFSQLLGRDYDVPPIVHSYNLRRASYRLASYRRAHAAYEILRRTLGRDLFNKALQEYMNRWNGKHPIPYDFFFTFNEVACEDLSWFWKPWFYEFGYADLALTKVNLQGGVYSITINRIGSFPVPVELVITYSDGSTDKINNPASVWKNNITEFIVEHETGKKIVKITLNDNALPDVDFSNNVLEPEKI